jgi:peptidoglycan/xylan/chitin deacetylase (PgdA/CDA1 family)
MLIIERGVLIAPNTLTEGEITMFVYTVTKKRALKMCLLIAAIITGIIIGIVAILNSVTTSADERRLPIYGVERDDNKIALTINAAWGNSNTDELLALLADENVPVTFFVTGEFADKYPEDVLKFFNAGHEVQSHSNAHPHVEGANINDLIHDTREASRKITAITGVAPTLYRAPYGEYDNNSIMTINGMGYKYIQWTADSIDWQGPSADAIVRRVVGATRSGGILLFHNDLANTTEALPTVISQLKERGFEFVTVSDLIYHDNYSINSNGMQVLSIQAQLHVAGSQVSAVFETLLQNLTLDEILSLEHGITPQLAVRLSSLLTPDEIRMVTALSDDELASAWGMLAEAKMTGANVQIPLAGNNEGTATTPTATTGDGKGKGYDEPQRAPDVTTPTSPVVTDTPQNYPDVPTSPTSPATTAATVPTSPATPPLIGKPPAATGTATTPTTATTATTTATTPTTATTTATTPATVPISPSAG